MKILTIRRNLFLPEGVPGIIFAENEMPFAVTLEHYKLYIPKGEYTCVKSWYTGGGYWTYEITGVHGRTRILFHKGNLAYDLKETVKNDADTAGCVLIGEKFDPVKGGMGIVESAVGFAQFLDKVKGLETFKLLVQEANGWAT